jgi:hypothetical protein
MCNTYFEELAFYRHNLELMTNLYFLRKHRVLMLVIVINNKKRINVKEMLEEKKLMLLFLPFLLKSIHPMHKAQTTNIP